MKYIYILTIIFWGCFSACTPGTDDFQEMGIQDMDRVIDIRLRISHHQLLADGTAQIEFCPLLINEDSIEVLDSRVDYGQIEFYTSSGEQLSRFYSTTDRSLVGKEISVTAKIKGRNLVSNAVTFRVIDAASVDAFQEITVPVIFHIFQSDSDIRDYGGEFPQEKIYQLLDKINHAFSGMVSRNAVGVNTKICFKAAEYDPYGAKLYEAGINRIFMEEVKDEANDQYKTLVEKQKALWPYDRYLNVWLISDRENEYTYFQYTVSSQCVPRYLNANVGTTDLPGGLTLTELPANWVPEPKEVGIFYKLQSLQTMVRTFGQKNENELIYSFGSYLGLLPTWGVTANVLPEDFCSDTHKYYGNTSTNINVTAYKLVGDCYFLAENIMDDPVGMHRSITLEQATRIHWVLNNCPERSAWKSDFAFKGK